LFKRIQSLMLGLAGLTLAAGCDGSPDNKGAATEAAVPDSTAVDIGVLSFDIPSGWALLRGAEEQGARRQIEAGVNDMMQSYSGAQSDYGLEEFKAVRLAGDAGWITGYTIRIPPEDDYFATIERDQKEKIEWGKSQGIIREVLEYGKTTVSGLEMYKVDAVARDGSRSVSLSYWTPQDPGRVGMVTILTSPNRYDSLSADLDALIESLRTNSQ